MSRKIYGVTVGTPLKPKKIIDEVEMPSKTSQLTNDSNFATEEFVEEEIAKFDFVKVVPALPEAGLPNRVYFVPKANTEDDNLFDEYAWINNAWEYFGTKKLEGDFKEFIKITDIAKYGELGLMTVLVGQGLDLTKEGYLSVSFANTTEIGAKSNYYKPITPIYIDYAVMKALTDPKNITWDDTQKALARATLGAVGSEDYAGYNKTGVVSVNNLFGVTTINNTSYKNTLVIQPANFIEIDKKEQLYRPIVPARLDYAVKKALSDCKLTGDDVWTDEEKAKALELLGGANKKYVDDLVGSVESILTELHAHAESLIGGES